MEKSEAVEADVVQGFDPRLMFAKGFDLGSVDLIQGGSFREAIGRTVIALLTGVRREDGSCPFSGSTVILPPESVSDLTTSAVLDAIATALGELRGFAATTEELEILEKKVRVIHCSTLETRDLLALVSGEGRGRLIAISEGSLYRDADTVLPPAFGVLAVRIEEDLWAAHVAVLCRECVQAVQASESYAVVHVNEIPAHREDNQRLLNSVDECYVVQLRCADDADDEVSGRFKTWLSMLYRGAMSEVIEEIERLKMPEVSRLYLLVQLFARAGDCVETIATITRIRPHVESMSADRQVHLARLAHKAGDDVLAHTLLPHTGDGLSTEMWIEEALELATYFEDDARIEQFDARLSLVYPNSERLRENRDRRLLQSCRGFISGSAITSAGFTDQHLALMDGVLSIQQSYENVIELAAGWGADWLELALICCAIHALSLDKFRTAADIATHVTSSVLYGRQAAQIVVESVRSMMLREEVSSKETDYYRGPLHAVVRFLAKHPADGSVRLSFSSLLSVDSCGEVGIPLIAATMLDIANAGIKLVSSSKTSIEEDIADAIKSDDPSEDLIKASIESGFSWMHKQGAAEPGVTVVPPDFLLAPPDDIVRFLSRIVVHSASKPCDETELTVMERLVCLASAICPHATDERDEDLRLMRLFAGSCALAGQFQRARNLAEQTLLMGQGSDVRRRLAWLAYADIYHRCRNLVEALVGLACALATDAPIEKADAWQEVYAVIRVLRDLGLFELAYQFLPMLKELLAPYVTDVSTDPRIVGLELGLRVKALNDAEHSKIVVLIEDIAGSCEAALNDRQELFGLAVLLGQVIQKADTFGLPVRQEARGRLEKALTLIGEDASQVVKIAATTSPSGPDVASMFNSVQQATYVSDAAGDYSVVSIAARRLLDTSELVEDHVLAVEVLADHTVALCGVPDKLESGWPIQYALTLNEQGLDVAFIAVKSDEELRLIYVTRGQAIAIEQPVQEPSFGRRMLIWLTKYPRQYGYIKPEDGDNEFFETMEKLNLRLPSSKSLVLVAEPLLQQLTANLVLTEPEEAGFTSFLGTKTAIGMVPSLTWLSTARTAKRIDKNKYKAWISSQGADDTGPLNIALSRLADTFQAFGFVVDTGSNLPRGMSDAAIAVVTAHGGLMSEGRFIRSISDDGDLLESPLALARSLAGAEVVVLFVCSGGRIDKHPWENTTVGLPKLLIDRGARAVIASPWPLNVTVTYRWLEPFLCDWEAGATVLQATKTANEAVARALGDSPQFSQAMTVFGDILLTKQPSP